MFRTLISVTKTVSYLGTPRPTLLQCAAKPNLVSATVQKYFSVFQPRITNVPLLNNAATINAENTRTITKYSMRKGKRKTAKPVVKR